jgi:hypothetical protein
MLTVCVLFVRVACLLTRPVFWLLGVIYQSCLQAFDHGRVNAAQLDIDNGNAGVARMDEFDIKHSRCFLWKRGIKE